ncbi:hypothetical protein [Pseudoramibacter alactolyticus]|uniref:hypothetical protein n=1 Tax=Pseudoramibacter alactolyticus TaxID=113287 RepID=UPI0028E7FB94|nr:hypothetical protein [Pseudoramibacter alactolyticus]
MSGLFFSQLKPSGFPIVFPSFFRQKILHSGVASFLIWGASEHSSRRLQMKNRYPQPGTK